MCVCVCLIHFVSAYSIFDLFKDRLDRYEVSVLLKHIKKDIYCLYIYIFIWLLHLHRWLLSLDFPASSFSPTVPSKVTFQLSTNFTNLQADMTDKQNDDCSCYLMHYFEKVFIYCLVSFQAGQYSPKNYTSNRSSKPESVTLFPSRSITLTIQNLYVSAQRKHTLF